MSGLLSNKWLQLALRLVLGAVFLYAGATKIQTPQAFADSIATFQLLPAELINLVAIALPIFEVLCGLLLILGWQKREIAFCLIVLTGFFAIFLIQGLARGLQIDCGCFGSGPPSATKTWISLGRDILLLIGSVILYRASLKKTVEESDRVPATLPSGSPEAP
jgi:putative oxidoreductase